MPLLQIESGKHRGKRVRLGNKAVIIGRGDGVDLRIGSSEISRQHCRIRVDGDAVYVEDLGSSNGTFVDGQPISAETRLPPGGLLHVGPMDFRLVGQGPEKEPAPKPRKKANVAGLKTKRESATEDEALAWLSEPDPEKPKANPEADTSIILAKDLPPAAKEKAPPRVFASVAEEAADIIRRHKEALTAG